MRNCAAALVVLLGGLAFGAQAYAQPVTPAPGRAPAARAAPAAKPAPSAPQRAAYAAIPEAERIAIQFDLIWTGDYNGLANGDFGESSIAAVKSFQKNNAGKETGVLNPDERARLAQGAKVRQARVAWDMVEDRVTGARLGLPTKLAPQQQRAGTGNRWQSGRGEVQVETFRMAGPGVTLARAFEQQKKEPAQRKVEYAVLRGDFFVVSGLQNLKKFYVRAHVKDDEVRGMTVLYDQAMEGIMDPIVVAMSNAFQPFPEGFDGGANRMVRYASGVVVSAAGDIVTDARAVEDCAYILVPGRGRAGKLATDGGLALIRLYGARGLAPLRLADGAVRAGSVALVGVADPQAQGGRGEVSTLQAQVAPGVDGAAVTPRPAPGFSGAAALDPDGRVVGVVTTRPQMLAGLAPAGPGAAILIPAESVNGLLAKNGVVTAFRSGPTSLEAAKAGVVRVICVRE